MRESRTDAVLVKDAVSGDDGAFAALAERHLPDLRRRIARVIADPDDVGDLAHDVLLHTLSRLHELRQPDRFGAWLGSIAMNAARDLRRRRVRQLRLEERFAAEGAPVLHAPVLQVGLSDELTEARVRRERVRRALARLSAPQRDVVVHH